MLFKPCDIFIFEFLTVQKELLKNCGPIREIALLHNFNQYFNARHLKQDSNQIYNQMFQLFADIASFNWPQAKTTEILPVSLREKLQNERDESFLAKD